MVFINDQKETLRQSLEAVREMENQNSLLIKNEEAVSQRNWTCDKEEDNNEDEGETNMSHVEENSVRELNEVELNTRVSLLNQSRKSKKDMLELMNNTMMMCLRGIN